MPATSGYGHGYATIGNMTPWLAAALLIGLVVAAPLRPGETQRSVWDGVYSGEQARRGQELYTKQCVGCHGSALQGTHAAPPLAGAGFLSAWSGLTVGDLFERVRASMPPDKPSSLSREAGARIMAYILQANDFPAGKTDLPQSTDALQRIRLEAIKPNE